MTITHRVRIVQKTIQEALRKYNRIPDAVTLLAVSKGQPASAIHEAFAAGLTHFGENYWQEARPKLDKLSNLPITWHFLGAIQSNKSAEIACHFNWVHTVSREKIARLLSRHRPVEKPPLNVCIQINLDSELGKTGLGMEEAAELAIIISQLPGLKLRGLMAIPEPHWEEDQQYQSLLRMSALLQSINGHLNCPMDTLSMGMSDDLVAAIAAGSTIVRIGRAIFGERNKPFTH